MKMGNNPNWGGKRSGSGRFQRNIHLSQEAVLELNVLTGQHRLLNPAITREQIVNDLIHAAWQELDHDIIRASDAASE